MALLHLLLAIGSLMHLTGGYDLKAKYDASNFFAVDIFYFYEGYDKFTSGLAEYVSNDDAMRLNLGNTDSDKVYLGVELGCRHWHDTRFHKSRSRQRSQEHASRKYHGDKY
jgi:hypothetical protein